MDIFELDAGSAARDEIPREALGRTLQARLDFWALAQGPDRLAEQVPPPPSSFGPTQPLTCSRVNPKTSQERLSSSRVPMSPLRSRSFKPSPSRIPRLITASQRFETGLAFEVMASIHLRCPSRYLQTTSQYLQVRLSTFEPLRDRSEPPSSRF
ncbi:hypothetical protein PISMIDRAFT_15657 [Pisolithus microcarpus 441]|uniref:Uncharacterized protein n=1 Tax=Pisolithus microcarpus 441 TaxID=765257 RepID=A0A0C9XW32_9AGAM|nr:hypothetical protein PISMIDRAFT_15657 [Pisolithus microcarpus 441]